MKRLLIILLALVVSGCSTRLKGLDDLAFVGMKYETQPPPFRERIRIDFSTSYNFQEEVIKNGFDALMMAAFCRQTEHEFPYFYLGSVWRLDEHFIELGDKIPESPKALHIYSIFFFDSRERQTGLSGETGEPPPRSTDQEYDLRKLPEDICVRFEMTYGMPPPLPKYSTIVRIPKEEFIKLFASHPQ